MEKNPNGIHTHTHTKSESLYCTLPTNATLYCNKKKFFKENILKGHGVEPLSEWI